jgi:hypothetical protein
MSLKVDSKSTAGTQQDPEVLFEDHRLLKPVVDWAEIGDA